MVFCDFKGPHVVLINVLILLFKQYMYATRCTQNEVSFMATMCNAQEYCKAEKQIANIDNKQRAFYNIWQPFI